MLSILEEGRFFRILRWESVRFFVLFCFFLDLELGFIKLRLEKREVLGDRYCSFIFECLFILLIF